MVVAARGPNAIARVLHPLQREREDWKPNYFRIVCISLNEKRGFASVDSVSVFFFYIGHDNRFLLIGSFIRPTKIIHRQYVGSLAVGETNKAVLIICTSSPSWLSCPVAFLCAVKRAYLYRQLCLCSSY